jgi:hypothetical protein
MKNKTARTTGQHFRSLNLGHYPDKLIYDAIVEVAETLPPRTKYPPRTIKMLAFRGHDLEVLQISDGANTWWDCLINREPAVRFATTPHAALETAKLLVEAK